METLVDAYHNLTTYLQEKADTRVLSWPLMDNPILVLTIIGVYYHFVRYSGPKFMEKRKPYNIKKVMIFYNFAQCVVNLWATYQGSKVIAHPSMKFLCTPLSYGTTPFEIKTALLSYMYMVIKFVDLFDTVFMVLRKNFHQISFLHVYHHLGMALGCWVVVRYSPGSHLSLVGVVNCFVHTIMYFYYLLTAYDPELKKSIWWKKHITKMQMVQFFIIAMHHAVALFNPSCTYPKIPLFIYLTQNSLMFYLFAKFYVNAYIKQKKRKD